MYNSYLIFFFTTVVFENKFVDRFLLFCALVFSFSPTDNKFASCSDDGLVKIWDFYRCSEEKVLRG